MTVRDVLFKANRKNTETALTHLMLHISSYIPRKHRKHTEATTGGAL